MVRAIRQSLEAGDVRLEEAARTLGSSRWRVFFTITRSRKGLLIIDYDVHIKRTPKARYPAYAYSYIDTDF